jgi:hypothetical protein
MKASAAKRGRNPRFPYVAVVTSGGHYDADDKWVERRTHNTNTRNAYATREEAVAFAQKWIDHAKATWAAQEAARAQRHGACEAV